MGYTIANLSAASVYIVRLRARNGAGWGESADDTKLWTDPDVPEPPTLLVGEGANAVAQGCSARRTPTNRPIGGNDDSNPSTCCSARSTPTG